MKTYDPAITPVSDAWLALDEVEQIELVADYHEQRRVELSNLPVHALMHVVVENQLAEGIEVVGEALARLMGEGLDRHEGIHAIGSVLMEHLRNLMQQDETGPRPHERYFQDLKTLTMSTWTKRTS
jgi:hypothetical protein